jgi:processive 1,2-diacylglycerol beta-glucosyltransferase
MERVLILTETVAGSGHYNAARALEKALKMKRPNIHVTIACVLPIISRSLESLVGTFYLGTLKYAPALWGAAYGKERFFNRLFRSPLGAVIAARLRSLMDEVKPRAVICTHALPLAACARLKREGFGFRLGAAVTDFSVNSFWIEPEVDFYLLAHEDLAVQIRSRNGQSTLYATGIPIDPAFSLTGRNKKSVRKALGLHPDRMTLLFLGGGEGLGPLHPCLRHLTSQLSGLPVQLLVVTGKNRRLYDELSGKYRHLPWLHLFRFVHNMDAFMSAADLMIGKPGGMTCSEALASGLPMLIVRPIPGQEEHNSRFLLEKQVALRQDHPKHVPASLLSVMESAETLEQMKRRALHLGKPRSALDAADAVLEQLN